MFQLIVKRAFWLALLMAVLALGRSEPARAAGASAQAVQSVVNSTEFRAYFVGSVYQTLLGRAATPAEAAPLVAKLQGDAQAWEGVVTSVAGSPAYFEKAGNTNAGFVNALFQDLVGRAPDATDEAPAALDFLQGGGSRRDMAGVVADTEEARAHWTQLFYRQLLGRAASGAEATSGAAKLKSGGINALAGQLLGSSEFWNKSGGSQSGWKSAVNQLLSGDTMTMDTNGTTPDVPMASPTTVSVAGNSTRAPMVQALLSSPEYLSNAIQSQYQKFLRRAATPAEVAGWNGASLDQVMMALLTSDEYFNRAGGTTTGYLNRLSKDLLGKSSSSALNNLPSTEDLVNLWNKLPRHKK